MIETILNVPNVMLDIRNNSNDTALDMALVTGRQINFDILLSKIVQTKKLNTLKIETSLNEFIQFHFIKKSYSN